MLSIRDPGANPCNKKRLHHHAEVKRQKLYQDVAVEKEQRKNWCTMMIEGKGKPGIFFVSSGD